ncbi:MAG: hypothetical protein HGA27_08720 [Peptococcaceae bacterium]|nr:hypothetical protein [Peptococcaceae bacterium]
MSNIPLMVADLMAMAIKTAPKARGQDCISYRILSGKPLEHLADEMILFSKKGKNFFARDGENIRNSAALILVTIDKNQKAGLNCGACGYELCEDLKLQENDYEYPGPFCAWRLIDLGIAIGSAVKTASILNADNRVMYSVGVVARKIGLTDHPFAVGIPISFTSKNIYFDRT